MRVYGFQITPGSDDALGYCRDSATAYEEALEHRREIKRLAAPRRLGPTAVYELALGEVTAETMLTILNGHDAVPNAFIVSKRLLGFVTED